jgi:hypothetical protein
MVGLRAQCLSQVVMRTNLEELVDLETCTLPLAQHCRDALACMPPADSSELSGGSADVLDWNNWVLELQNKLQKVLSKRIDKKLHTALLRSLDAPSKARLFSCAGPLASAWQLHMATSEKAWMTPTTDPLPVHCSVIQWL